MSYRLIEKQVIFEGKKCRMEVHHLRDDLSGKRTASGKPILANDPHLEFGLPSTWYMIHLQAPSLNVSGAARSIPLISSHSAYAALRSATWQNAVRR